MTLHPKMTERYQQLTDWLSENFDNISLTPLAGDASARQYYRLTLPDNTTRIVMDHPPEHGSTLPFIQLAKSFRDAGLAIPHIFNQSTEMGFVVIEDFGDQLFLNCLNSSNAETLYKQALNQLVVLHRQPATPLGQFKALDDHLIEFELNGFQTWYLEKHLRLSLTSAEQKLLKHVTQWLSAELAQQPKVFMHRDFHSRNLILKPDDRIGVIDFQDAMLGPITYDLASLLRDCYIRWPNTLVENLALYYKTLAEAQGLIQDIDDKTFLRWLDIAGIERHLKAIFTFSRKSIRDQDNSYLRYLPRTLGYLLSIMPNYSELHEFSQWLEEKTP